MILTLNEKFEKFWEILRNLRNFEKFWEIWEIWEKYFSRFTLRWEWRTPRVSRENAITTPFPTAPVTATGPKHFLFERAIEWYQSFFLAPSNKKLFFSKIRYKCTLSRASPLKMPPIKKYICVLTSYLTDIGLNCLAKYFSHHKMQKNLF